MKDSTGLSRSARRQQWLEKIDSAIRLHGLQHAEPLALQAIAEGVEHPALLNIAASFHHRQGQFGEAVELLKRARALAPKDANILNSLGVCLKSMGQLEAALEAYQSAIRLNPDLAPAHCNRGAVLQSLNDLKGARAAYERAAALDPRYVEPLASIAWLDAQAGNSASAREQAERALALSPGNALGRMALAQADIHSGNLPDGTARLAEILRDPALAPVNRSIALGLFADVLDAEGRCGDAFAAYAASNAELKRLNAPQFEAPDTPSPLENAKRLDDWFETADREPWTEAPVARPRAADPKLHVFLVGFPRSGTTLLENVLAAHPDVVTLEEKDCLQSASETYLGSNEGLERLSRISSGEAARQRDSYWTAVRRHSVEPRDNVFIDKMPLASVALPLIAKLFPNARVLFARRDPRDVVLSCFRRRFGMNPSMYQLLTLDGAAAYYDAVMRLSEHYREMLPLPQHIVRYESLVDDFEGTARAACDFLNLDWDHSLLDFAKSARSRGISTPSAAQVARGLNREGKGAWRRYAEQMRPVLPLLEPWVRRFGYDG